MKTPKLISMVLLICAAVLFCISIPGWAQKGKPQPPPQPAADPAIAYIGYRSWARTDLMVMNADGTNQKILLSRDTGGYFDPAWSPDSSRIAYCANLPGGYGIYVMNKDGSGMCRVVSLTNDCSTAGDPQWSPSGTEILYMDYVSEPAVNAELFLVDAVCDATNKTNLTNTPYVDEYEPAWSADGTRIATVATPTSAELNSDLVLYELASNLPRKVVSTFNLTTTTQLSGKCCLKPNWSRSSSETLAISTDEIYIVNVKDPSNPTFTNVTNTLDYQETFPAWSPDDQQIVYSRERGIWVMNASGTNAAKIAVPSKTDRWTRYMQADWRRIP